MSKIPKYIKAADMIREAESVVVLTGAGVSTESGIPDFRSSGGLYTNMEPFHINTLKNSYEQFYDFCKTSFVQYKDCKPNPTHQILSDWESQGMIDAVITQNVDGLHQKAGSKKVVELHGTMNTARCIDCNRPVDVQDFMEKKECSFCGGKLRPDIVLFGDPLPEEELQRAFSLCGKADLVVVIGSSMEVMPACDLPFISEARTLLVNGDSIEKANQFDFCIYGKASQVLSEIDKLL